MELRRGCALLREIGCRADAQESKGRVYHQTISRGEISLREAIPFTLGNPELLPERSTSDRYRSRISNVSRRSRF